MFPGIWKRLPKYVFLLYAFIFLLFLQAAWHSKSERKIIGPKWLERKLDSCLPARKVGFLKTHKAASSTIQNILFRYGIQNNLTFALPPFSNYFGGETSFNAKMVAGYTQFNIFAIHTKWNHKQIHSVMGNETVYFSIIRDPIDLFESLFSYMKFEQQTNMTIDEYVENMNVLSARLVPAVGFNQMMWDFGLPLQKMDDEDAIQQLISEANKNFHLVLLAERMEESLILLRHLLCTDIKDMVSFRINVLQQNLKKSIKKETRNTLKLKLAPDYQLYNHFRAKFEMLIRAFGKDRMNHEVLELRKLSEEFEENCGLHKFNASLLSGPNKPWSNMVLGYESKRKSFSCRSLAWAELSFLDYLRHRQRRRKKPFTLFEV